MIGAGTKFNLTTDSGTTYVPVAKIKDLAPNEESREVTEDSYLDETDLYKNFVTGMFDGGEVTLTLAWNAADTEQIELNTRFQDAQQASENYQFEFPNGATYTFPALVTGRGKAIPKNETMTQNFTFKVTGKPIEVNP